MIEHFLSKKSIAAPEKGRECIHSPKAKRGENGALSPPPLWIVKDHEDQPVTGLGKDKKLITMGLES